MLNILLIFTLIIDSGFLQRGKYQGWIKNKYPDQKKAPFWTWPSYFASWKKSSEKGSILENVLSGNLWVGNKINI